MTTKPNIFKVTVNDYLTGIGSGDSKITIYEAVEITNRIIESKLGGKVYGRWNGVFRHFGESYVDSTNPENTHTAYLFDIQELPKKDCVHEPIRRIYEDAVIRTPVYEEECKHCGIELTARWEAKK